MSVEVNKQKHVVAALLGVLVRMKSNDWISIGAFSN